MNSNTIHAANDNTDKSSGAANPQKQKRIPEQPNLAPSVSNQKTKEPPSKAEMLADLTREKSLFQTWLSSRRLGRSEANLAWTLITGCFLGLYAFLPIATTSEIASMVRVWVDLGIGFATSILGFLIAGFTIFASLSRPELFERMAQEHKKNGLSFLKDSFLRLLRVFAEYWAFVFFCLLIKVFAYAGGPLSILVNVLPQSTNIKYFLARVGFILLGMGIIHSIMILQSFIFNIHNFVMLGVSWDIRLSNQKSKNVSLEKPPTE